MATIRFDFGTGFDLTESPTGEFNISLDASEVNAAAGASAVGDTAAAGTAATFASSDHRHGREAFATPAFTFGTSNAAGVATTPIRSDATLAIFDATVPTTQAVGDAAAAGTAGVAARRDHTHGREAFAVPAFSFGTANAAGSAATLVRSDATLAIFDTTVPVTQASADAAATGTAAVAARRDHRHGMPTISTPGLTWVGGDTTERTTATGAQVNLVTISSLSIAQTSPILVTLSWRKTTGAAVNCSLGLKLNTTEVRPLAAVGVGTNTADSGTVMYWVNAVTAASQGVGMQLKTSVQGGGNNVNDISTARPAATITDVVIIASSENALVTLAVDEVHVYTFATA